MNIPIDSSAQYVARGPVDLAVLGGFLATIGSQVGPELILSPGKDLFHYTDLGGLLGILQTDDLWLTHCRFANDDEEMSHGHRIAASVITAAMGGPDKSPFRLQFLRRLQALLNQPLAEGVYVCCFCQSTNLLSQWRGYGGNGAGVSIQFQSGGFSPWAGNDCAHGLMRFWQVTYQEETQRKIVSAAIEHSWSWNWPLSPEECAQRAADAIQFFVPTFKNSDFMEESEWRLVFTPNAQCAVRPRFRTRGALLVPYYSLRDLFPNTSPRVPLPAHGSLPITGMMVGPGSNKALNVESLRMMLDGLGYTNISVEASTTPFRP